MLALLGSEFRDVHLLEERPGHLLQLLRIQRLDHAFDLVIVGHTGCELLEPATGGSLEQALHAYALVAPGGIHCFVKCYAADGSRISQTLA